MIHQLTTIITICVFFLSSCLPNDRAFPIGAEKSIGPRAQKFNVGKEPTTKFVDAFGLKTSVLDFDENSMSLHGRFFNDRIVFYTIDDPGMKIHNINVASMTLYFIDSTLMRKKYILKEDISTPLIQTFGNFKFRPLHTNERKALENKEVLNQKNGKTSINEKLANYQLKWIQDVNTLIYRSSYNFNDSTFTYELVQEVNYYKPYFRMVENMD